MTSETLATASTSDFSLEASRSALTSGTIDASVVEAIETAMRPALDGDLSLSSLQQILVLMEDVRTRPPGTHRIAAMNAFVRTLGRPNYLACLLDLLKVAAQSKVESEAEVARLSHTGRMHCLYGWASQTLLVATGPEATEGTEPPRDGLDFLGYPPAEWDLSIHIWQANPEAEAFESTKEIEADQILEPPHSHPFDFVSYVSCGEIRQSIYVEDQGAYVTAADDAADRRHRYDGVTLERVDGVWPPHQERQSTRLDIVEERVLLQAGDSYFMPYHAIHDMEIDRATSEETPAITLFMPSEAVVKPLAFMAPSMADYHDENPDLKALGRPLTFERWVEKLDAVAAYLRGDAKTLRLGDIVNCESKYAFMHV
jgi:hypothetical protein